MTLPKTPWRIHKDAPYAPKLGSSATPMSCIVDADMVLIAYVQDEETALHIVRTMNEAARARTT